MAKQRIQIDLSEETLKSAGETAEAQDRSRKNVIEHLVNRYFALLPHEQMQVDKLLNTLNPD